MAAAGISPVLLVWPVGGTPAPRSRRCSGRSGRRRRRWSVGPRQRRRHPCASAESIGPGVPWQGATAQPRVGWVWRFGGRDGWIRQGLDHSSPAPGAVSGRAGGPLSFQPDSYTGGLPKLVYRPDSWTKVANVIFLDSPVGAGFSYSAADDGYTSSDTQAVKQIAIFLTKWYEEHPEFLPNPLYISGDSYSGLIVPPLTLQIARGIEIGEEPVLNLKGYIIGNPLTDPKFDVPAKFPYVHGMGLISDEQYEIYRESCGSDTGMAQNTQCTSCLDAIDKCLKGINIHHILEPECSSAYNENSGSGTMLLDDQASAELRLPGISWECRDEAYVLSSLWANDKAVREALGVQEGTVPVWLRCNHGTPYTTDIKSSMEYHRSVTGRGYRSLIYSGDHDMVVPFVGTQVWIRSLGFSVVDDWRPWYVTGQVAGFTTLYANNLTFATIKGGGHTAPEYRPKECLAMVAGWLSGRPL